MNVLFRSLSSEAIENCITCLNFKFDEVYFFGLQKIIDEEKQNIGTFIKNRCGVKTHFKSIDGLKLNEINKLVKSCIDDKNNNYFDMTGNESLLQVAMTNIAYEKNVPMHIYDVINNTPINIDDDIKGSIFDVKANGANIYKLNIKEYIRMVGGLFQNKMTKPEKGSHEYDEYMKLCNARKHLGDIWPYFSMSLQICKDDEKNQLHVSAKDRSLLLKNASKKINDRQLIDCLLAIQERGLISDFRYKENGLSFTYASKYIKKTIKETGSILEQEVFDHEKRNSDDCKVGIHLDWDGIVSKNNDDVYNEIDVLKLNGYVLTFISCKDTMGLVSDDLYELETIARRFGGKYCKMVLVCKAIPSKTFLKRAASIGIQVIQKDDLFKKGE